MRKVDGCVGIDVNPIPWNAAFGSKCNANFVSINIFRHILLNQRMTYKQDTIRALLDLFTNVVRSAAATKLNVIFRSV